MRSLRTLSLPLWLFSLFASVAALSVDAQTAPVAAEFARANPVARDQEELAVVIVFNRPVFVVRAPLMGYSPPVRAKAIMGRIDKLIDQEIYGPVTTETRTEGTIVMIDGHLAFSIQPGDVDSVTGKTLDETVSEAVKFLTTALAEAAHQNSPAYLMKATAKAVGATLVFAFLAWLLLSIYRCIRPHILRLTKQGGDRLMARGLFFFAQLLHGLLGLIQLVLWLVLLGIGSEWITLCLKWFPYTQPWGEALQENLLHVIGGIFRTALVALPDLIVIVFIVALTRGVLAIIKGFFSGVESGQVRLDWMNVEAARATRRIVTVIVWLFAIVMIYPYIPGSSSSAFKGMSVFVGVLFSLGSSSVVGQFTSGLVLMYSRALRPGEYVSIGDREGTVESLGFLSTKMRSPKNEEFHMPNTVILATSIKNYSRLAEKGGLFVYTTVSIGYDAPWRQIHALLLEAARRTPGLLPVPAPFVHQKSLSDFYVEYQINACVEKPGERDVVLAVLHANIQDQFNTHGVQIMSPHYYQDKDRPVVVPKAKWFEAPAAPDS